MLQIVIPAFNEERRLARTLRELRRHVDASSGMLGRVEVIVVDNASTDSTAQVAQEADSSSLPVRVLRCERRGKGAAVRAGLLATDAPLVCFMDADGATRLDALERAWSLVQRGAEVVIGSRGLAESDTSARHSRLRSRGASAYRGLTAHLVPGIADTQCGFKLFRGDLVRGVLPRLQADGFSFDVELLVRLRAAGARIEELPVTWVDVPGSTFVPARHGAAAFTELAGIAWRTRGLVVAAARTAPAGAARATAPRPSTARRPVSLPVGVAAVVVPLVAATTGDLRERGGR